MKQNQQHSKIQTIPVTRKIEKEITYTKLVDTQVEVNPIDLTIKELQTVLSEYHLPLAIFFKKRFDEAHELTLEQGQTIQEFLQNQPQTQHVTQPYDLLNVTIHTDTPKPDSKAATSHPHAGHGGGSGEVGAKVGSTSKYHYCYFDRTAKCWRTTHNNIRHKDEIEAALASDRYLEMMNDELRPLNRREFHEVKESYERTDSNTT